MGFILFICLKNFKNVRHLLNITAKKILLLYLTNITKNIIKLKTNNNKSYPCTFELNCPECALVIYKLLLLFIFW